MWKKFSSDKIDKILHDQNLLLIDLDWVLINLLFLRLMLLLPLRPCLSNPNWKKSKLIKLVWIRARMFVWMIVKSPNLRLFQETKLGLSLLPLVTIAVGHTQPHYFQIQSHKPWSKNHAPRNDEPSIVNRIESFDYSSQAHQLKIG